MQPSPGDPNTFTGNATVTHTETSDVDESVLHDIKVDWNLRRNSNF